MQDKACLYDEFGRDRVDMLFRELGITDASFIVRYADKILQRMDTYEELEDFCHWCADSRDVNRSLPMPEFWKILKEFERRSDDAENSALMYQMAERIGSMEKKVDDLEEKMDAILLSDVNNSSPAMDEELKGKISELHRMTCDALQSPLPEYSQYAQVEDLKNKLEELCALLQEERAMDKTKTFDMGLLKEKAIENRHIILPYMLCMICMILLFLTALKGGI
ncbi:MAG: hypothetical protein HUJ76_04835 [Parasporobacterium sp.]|nr:hypothetical protein [Holdemanella sp.]MCF0229001.1 hypothetical protein [Parasporobacterium sp.]